MAKEIQIVTPAGIAVWPKLTKPDVYGEYADSKYKTELELSVTGLTTVKAQIKEAMKSMSFKVKDPRLPFKVGKDGIERLVAKSKFLPTIFDAKKNKILDGKTATVAEAEELNIGGGSIIRIGGTLFPYDKGVSLQLNTVQLITLVAGQGGPRSADGFDEEDGYEAPTKNPQDADDSEGADEDTDALDI